ncbi:MAG TPA: RNA polymerase sigma factor [Acidimicrobiia bacterium]|jgi:RNA polymerase sigma-70 factor (ECF subfamily)|nr:RNA polymerase sigma factor [Acidimicrobiia bacterium]
MQELRVESSVDLLVDRAREGDRNAFGDLVRLHQHEVFTLAVRLVADRTVAADVAQDAFIRAWRALPKFRGDAAFPTWLHRITVNAAWSQRRRAAARPVSQLDEALAVPDTDPLGQPERVGEVADLRRALGEAIGALPIGMRAVVVLKDVYGWSHDDVARALGISETAAKVRLHRAHLRLREMLDGRRP